MQYDPNLPPDPDAWLSLDELDRLDMIADRFSGQMMADGSRGEFDMAGYTAALEALTTDEWRGSAPEDPVEEIPDEPPPAPVWRASPRSSDIGEEQRDLLASFLEPHCSEGALIYPETAGFLFAVLACPGLVEPSEWMPEVLGGTAGRLPGCSHRMDRDSWPNGGGARLAGDGNGRSTGPAEAAVPTAGRRARTQTPSRRLAGQRPAVCAPCHSAVTRLSLFCNIHILQ